MYLVSLKAKQVKQAVGLTCDVEISWEYGNQLPDLIEIYENDTKIAQIKVDKASPPTSTTVSLTAGTQLQVSACPRLLSHEILPDEMPNLEGKLQYWETFCLVTQITTKAAPGTGDVESKPKPAPIINLVKAIPASVSFLSFPTPTIIKQRAKIRIAWLTSYDYDQFLVRWSSNYDQWYDNSEKRRWNANKYAPVGGETRVEEGGKSGSFVLEGVMPGLTYTFSVKGRDSGFLGLSSIYSNWSAPSQITVPNNINSLRHYLTISQLNAQNGIKQYLFADTGSIKSFMQL